MGGWGEGKGGSVKVLNLWNFLLESTSNLNNLFCINPKLLLFAYLWVQDISKLSIYIYSILHTQFPIFFVQLFGC